jgi:hypothetical protein
MLRGRVWRPVSLKARWVSAHLDEAWRHAGLQAEWPTMLRAATRRHGLIRCEDEASGAQGGSLSYTGARRGQPPAVKTSGKRKGDKVFGAIEYCAGRLFSQGLASRCTSASSQAFWQTVLAQTTAPLFRIHDRAKYHTRKATQEVVESHRERLTMPRLPSYSPDYNPIEYLWKKEA